jgi:ABC-type transporter lipoprotein component MlaA
MALIKYYTPSARLCDFSCQKNSSRCRRGDGDCHFIIQIFFVENITQPGVNPKKWPLSTGCNLTFVRASTQVYIISFRWKPKPDYINRFSSHLGFPALLLVILALVFPLSSKAQATNTVAANSVAEKVILPPSVPDPIEPFNRAMWGFNKGLMTGVIKPTSRVYRFVVVKPVRTGINNFSYNLLYPGRLINNLLQGKWIGARNETYRFACNTTVGVAGFWDVATKWKIQKSDADFGQTFGKWGWHPDFFIMLPFFGPSNDRDTVGLIADTAANPLLYIMPYNFEWSRPFTYLGPYSYFNIFATYNSLSDSVGEYVRFSQAEADPYSEIQYAWTFARANRVADFQVKGTQDPASL